VTVITATDRSGTDHDITFRSDITVELVDSMGSDASVIAAARVSTQPRCGRTSTSDLSRRLMGVPQNWLTPSTSVETGSYQQWQQQHSSSSPDDSTSPCRP
jgi:hypothetical protein